MTRLLSEDLLLLCWNDTKGKPHSACEKALPVAMGGALALDLILAEAITTNDKRIRLTNLQPDHELLRDAWSDLAAKRRPPRIAKAVQLLGTSKRFKAVRGYLERSGILRAEQHRFLGAIPITRYMLAERDAAHSVRTDTIALLTGMRDPAKADPRELMLATLAEPTKAINVLLDRKERKAARKRAKEFAIDKNLQTAISDAVWQVQHAAIAVTAAAAVAVSS